MCHRSKAGLTDCGSFVTSVEPGRCTFCCTARVVTVMKECRSQRLCCSRFHLDDFGFRNGISLPSTDLNGNFKDEHDEKPLEISGYPDLTLKYKARGMTWSHFNPLALWDGTPLQDAVSQHPSKSVAGIHSWCCSCPLSVPDLLKHILSV